MGCFESARRKECQEARSRRLCETSCSVRAATAYYYQENGHGREEADEDAIRESSAT